MFRTLRNVVLLRVQLREKNKVYTCDSNVYSSEFGPYGPVSPLIFLFILYCITNPCLFVYKIK